MPVHRALGRAGSTRGVQPEGRGVGGGRVDVVGSDRGQLAERGRGQAADRHRSCRIVGHHGHDRAGPRIAERVGHQIEVLGADRDPPGPGIGQDLGDAVGAQHG